MSILHMKGCSTGLVLIERLRVTCKWAIYNVIITETNLKQLKYLLSLLGQLKVNASVREQTGFFLLVFLIVYVLNSRTWLIFVVAFIAENRQLFFSFDILQKFTLNKKNVRSRGNEHLVQDEKPARPGFDASPVPLFTRVLRVHMSTGEVLV